MLLVLSAAASVALLSGRAAALDQAAVAFLRAFCDPAQSNVAAVTNWCTPSDADICGTPWTGVECSADQSTLVGLALDFNGALVGHWPAVAADALPLATLRRLAVRGARIDGALDAGPFFANQAGALETLELRDSPVSLDAVRAVRDAGASLRVVDIDAVNARGDVGELGQLCAGPTPTAPLLRTLRVAYGALRGAFAADAFLGCEAAGPLHVVDLRHNALRGTVPDSLCLVATLETLDMSRNKFTALPECLADLNPQTVQHCAFTYNRLCEIPEDRLAYLPCDIDSKPRAEPDECGVCNGDASSCVDCLGVRGGPATADACGVCEGNNGTCTDCAGVLFGTSVVDGCGECNGDNSTCADCAGVPNGTGCYDVCDVCNGDGTACIDCAGVLFGTSVLDACGECNGDGQGCLDCAGVPKGGAVYDRCDVCGGDGTSCVDCAGVVGGSAAYDKCGVCGGDTSSCGLDTLVDADAELWTWVYVFVALVALVCLVGSFICCNLCGTQPVAGVRGGGGGGGGGASSCGPKRRTKRHVVL